MGIGRAAGDNRSVEAAQMAINSPLLEVSITGAKGVLFAIAGGEDLGMLEIQESARVITESIDPQARVIFGAIRDEKLKKNELKVTVIATGFPEETVDNGGSFIARSFPTRDPEPSPQPEAEVTRDTPEPATSRGKIFNSLSPRSQDKKPDRPKNEDIQTQATSEKPPLKREPKPVDQIDEMEDDDWGAVPAFLRRSKLK
jgi:cell division protein FtsZ